MGWGSIGSSSMGLRLGVEGWGGPAKLYTHLLRFVKKCIFLTWTLKRKINFKNSFYPRPTLQSPWNSQGWLYILTRSFKEFLTVQHSKVWPLGGETFLSFFVENSIETYSYQFIMIRNDQEINFKLKSIEGSKQSQVLKICLFFQYNFFSITTGLIMKFLKIYYCANFHQEIIRRIGTRGRQS